MVENVVYWINSFPSHTGCSEHMSPATIVLGRSRPDFSKKHIAFGAYAMIYNGTANNMTSRTVPAIALKPSNQHGGSFFMSLLTGQRLHAYLWQELPISDEVINRVEELAKAENQPPLQNGELIFEWNIGVPIIGEAISNENAPVINELHEGNESTQISDVRNASDMNADDESDNNLSYDDSENDSDRDEQLSDDPQQHSIDGFFDEEPIESVEGDSINTAPSINPLKDEELQDANLDFMNETNDNMRQSISNDEVKTNEIENVNESFEEREIETPLEHTESTEDDNTQPTLRTSSRANKGMINRMVMDHGGKDYRSYTSKQLTQIQQFKKDQRKTRRALTITLMQRVRKSKNSPLQLFQVAIKSIFLSAQMNARKGIKQFGERAVAAMIKEFEQLDQGAFPGKPVVMPVDAGSLTPKELEMAMEAVNLIKEKKGGKVKGRTCANGSRERKFLKYDESVASPTVSTEGMFGTFMIDAYEGRVVGISNIPGAYLHAEMEHSDDRRVILVLRDEFVDLMCQANPKYLDYVKVVKGRKVLYLKVLRALYGCIRSALLWYELFSSTLTKMNFVINPYDKCIANKMVDGAQCTIVWYVDDVKVSHVNRKVVEDVMKELEEHFGTLDVTYGPKQEYLGMNLEIKDKKIIIDMTDQVDDLVDFFDEDITNTVSSPGNKNLMNE